MTTTLGKIRVQCMATLLLAAVALPPASALAQTAPGASAAAPAVDPVGRWRQSEERNGHRLAIGTLEIAPCEAGFCGRLVEDAGCSAVVMHLAVDAYGELAGELAMEDRTFDVYLTAGEVPGESLVLTATEGLSVVSRSSLPLGALLLSAGPAHCPPLPVS